MDQNQNMSGGQMNSFPGAPAGGNKSSVAVVGGIVLIVVLALLGWYILQGQNGVNTPGAQVPVAVETGSDAATAALSAQGTADDVPAIDADLKATDLNSLSDVNTL